MSLRTAVVAASAVVVVAVGCSDASSPGGDATPPPSTGPAIVKISPESIVAGGFSLNLTVTGTRFSPSSVVTWNGSPRNTFFVDASTLNVGIGSHDIADPGTATITVVNPAPDSGTSNAARFVIKPAPPQLTGINPNTVAAGGPSFVLTCFGVFRPSDVIQWNGQSRATSFNGTASLSTTILAQDIAVAGNASIRVLDTASGLASGAATYRITELAAPQLSSTSPSNGVIGMSSLTLDVKGSFFVPGMTVQITGDPRPTTFVDATTLRATLTAKDLATATVLPMNIRNPATGQLSNVLYFVVSLTATPGPIVPIPASLWQPPPGVLPSSGTYLYTESDSGDYIGGGHPTLIAGGVGFVNIGDVIAATQGMFSAGGWDAWFETMAGVPQFVTGYYANVANEGFSGAGGMHIDSPGRGCGGNTGWFAIDTVSYTGLQLSSFTARFEQHCVGAAPGLRGIIHWRTP